MATRFMKISQNVKLERPLINSGFFIGGYMAMNKLLADIVTASGGTVTNPNNRNQLLRDWLAAVE